MSGFGICAIFKNEARYLREWVEFHLLVGADFFMLYDNGSTDEWQRELEPYMGRSVGVQPWPDSPGQLSAYADAISRCVEYDLSGWMAFLDIDEYLYSPTGLRVPEYLESVDLGRACGVGVNWRTYGTNMRYHPSGDLLIASYLTHADIDDPINAHVKAIVQPSRCMPRSSDPHHFQPREGFTPMVNTDGTPINGPFNPTIWEGLVVNHYMSKSIAEAKVKASVPRSDTGEFRPLEVLTEPALNVSYEEEIATMYESLLRARLATRELPS